MTTRRAACSCGQLSLAIAGEPVRISMCHCLECQRRTGAVISNQARFRREQVAVAGTATEWTRSSDSGNALTFRFCPVCGSTVYWTGEGFPDYIAVAIGTFADPTFPRPPSRSGRNAATPGSPHPPPRRRSARRSRGDPVSGSRTAARLSGTTPGASRLGVRTQLLRVLRHVSDDPPPLLGPARARAGRSGRRTGMGSPARHAGGSCANAAQRHSAWRPALPRSRDPSCCSQRPPTPVAACG